VDEPLRHGIGVATVDVSPRILQFGEKGFGARASSECSSDVRRSAWNIVARAFLSALF
jgi:hypothetical protein